jgi:hypothetical protein
MLQVLCSHWGNSGFRHRMVTCIPLLWLTHLGMVALLAAEVVMEEAVTEGA